MISGSVQGHSGQSAVACGAAIRHQPCRQPDLHADSVRNAEPAAGIGGYARSSEFLQTLLMQNLRWMRVPGDTIFFLGAVALVLFVAGLKTGHSFRRNA